MPLLDLTLAACAWIAGSVLLASGVLKLGRTAAFHESLPHLGVPAFLRRTTLFARVFPFGEIVLGLGALLLPLPWARLPLAVATALFAVFVVVAVKASREPEPVECECFGGLGDARMTTGTVVRNAVFLALSLAGLLAPVSVAGAAVALVGLAVLPLVLSTLVIGVLVVRRNTSSSSSASSAGGSAFGAGATPPPAVKNPPAAASEADAELALFTAGGQSIPLAEFAEPATHLVFFSPDCISCQELVERFRWWPHGLSEGVELLPVLLGEKEDFADYEAFAPLIEHALYDPRRRVARRLGLQGTPGHAFLDAEHPFGTGWSAGATAIEAQVLRPGFYAEQK